MHQTYQGQIWNETDFALFYEEYASPILNYLRTQTRTLEDAEDVLVEVFMAARRHGQIIHEAPGGKSAWLRQVARNKMVDYYRRNEQIDGLPLEKAGGIVDPASEFDPEQVLVRMEALEHLQSAIKHLSLPQQELLRLRFAEGLHCPQIATRMGKREGATRTWLMRTLQTLREHYHLKREDQL